MDNDDDDDLNKAIEVSRKEAEEPDEDAKSVASSNAETVGSEVSEDDNKSVKSDDDENNYTTLSINCNNEIDKLKKNRDKSDFSKLVKIPNLEKSDLSIIYSNNDLHKSYKEILSNLDKCNKLLNSKLESTTRNASMPIRRRSSSPDGGRRSFGWFTNRSLLSDGEGSGDEGSDDEGGWGRWGLAARGSDREGSGDDGVWRWKV